MNGKHRVIKALSRFVPARVRAAVRQRSPAMDYDQYLAELADPYAKDEPQFVSPGSPCVLGIIKEFLHYHKSYIAACREMGISYKVLDISGCDWVRVIEQSQCDAFLVWPSVATRAWKDMFDSRMRIMVHVLGKTIYPTFPEIWIYENKNRAHDWLTANDIPHPRTWVFYNREEAEEFVAHAEIPLLFKTSQGATGSGIRILRSRSEAQRIVKQVFCKGFYARRSNPLERQWGNVYFQEYLPNVKEWRMVRIGNSYFGYRKERVGDFHSGSHAWSWLDPPRPLLKMLRDVTQRGRFTSMNVDIFETEDGRLLVNELQTVFGASTPVDQLRVNDIPGRYVFDDQENEWLFEEGDFSRNACTNERIDYLVNTLLKRK